MSSSTPLLTTKLYIPPARPTLVARPRLMTRLTEGLSRPLTLISAPAGFGKTTLVSEWVAGGAQPVAWLSLDAGDSDPARFLAYLVAALQTIIPDIGAGVLAALESPQPPAAEALLTVLLNELAAVRHDFILVLDDYHLVDARPVDQALSFLIEHQPPPMHLAIATREDPQLPLARLRARGQLTELRAADLRFTPAEAAEFLNRTMGLSLSADDVTALEIRTEGWIAGLQLAALSMQGRSDTASFIQAFTGSHHFVLDYLVEEVLSQQTTSVQAFLLHTSILDRLCGPLCDALLGARDAQFILEHLERANLFIVPLDNERRWYRYHHLFADLLRQRLGQSLTAGAIAELHIRASQWYEDHTLDVQAFHHAAAANDIERAERLIQKGRIPLYALAAVTAILDWLDSLPKTVLNARPWLWVRSAVSTLMAGRVTGVEEKLHAAEVALAVSGQQAEPDDRARDLTGQIAAIRATLAIVRYQPEVTVTQARRALEYLHPDNLTFRARATWVLGAAYRLQGDRVAARQTLSEAVRLASGDTYHTVLASASLGQLQESENELHQAAETYRRSLQLLSDQGPPNASEEYIGLARICYEWNDLAAAAQYGQQSLELARQYDRTLDRYIFGEVLLARVQLARGDGDGAAAMLDRTEQSARQNHFTQRLPEIAAVQILTLLRQGQVAAAAQLARQYDLPLSRARVLIAQGDPTAALAVLAPYRQQMEARGWADERLQAIILQAVALQRKGDRAPAMHALAEALALAEPGGFIRLFVDEGEPMRMAIADFRLRIERRADSQNHQLIGYVDKLLAAFTQPAAMSQSKVENPKSKMLEPLSERELEILGLIAQGLSNREIGQRLFLALDTVKGHNRHIFDKLQVASRTEAIARARELGLL